MHLVEILQRTKPDLYTWMKFVLPPSRQQSANKIVSISTRPNLHSFSSAILLMVRDGLYCISRFFLWNNLPGSQPCPTLVAWEELPSAWAIWRIMNRVPATDNVTLATLTSLLSSVNSLVLSEVILEDKCLTRLTTFKCFLSSMNSPMKRTKLH